MSDTRIAETIASEGSTSQLTHQQQNVRAVEVCVYRDEDGFSAHVPALPGAVGCGDSEPEALADCEEALHLLIESYHDMQKSVPWRLEPEGESGYQSPARCPELSHKPCWVVVDA